MPEQPQGEQRAELATLENDPQRLFGGNLVRRPDDEVLDKQGRAHLLKIYRDLKRDPQVSMALDKRVSQVVEAEWVVEPGRREGMEPTAEDRRMRDLAEAQLKALGEEEQEGEHASAQLAGGFDRLVEGLLDAILLGFQVAEVVWDVEGSETVVQAAPIREERRFRFDGRNRLRLRTQGNLLPGRLLPPRKFIVHQFGSQTDPYGRGLGHQLYWPVFFKRQNMSFWLRFLDKHGGPTVVGKHPDTYDADSPEVESLMQALQAVHTDSAITIPESMEVDFLDAAAKASSTGAYDDMADLLDAYIVKTILGVTLTTELDGQGSYAATETHQDDQRRLGRQDSKLVDRTINDTLMRWLTAYNSDGAVPPRVRHQWPDLDDRESLATTLVSLAKVGYRPAGDKGSEWVNEKFADGEEVFEDTGAPSGRGPAGPAVSLAEVGGQQVNLTPPEAMQNAAQAYLDAREDGLVPDRCGSGRGRTRARQIAENRLTPADFVSRDRGTPIPAYLKSHEGDVSTDKPPTDWGEEEWSDCGNAQYAAWGGTGSGTALDWARRKANQISRAMDEAEPYDLQEAGGPEDALSENLGVVAHYADRLEEEAAPVFGEMLDRIDEELAEAGSIGEAVRRIDDLYPELESDRLAEVMQEALGAAYGAGRVEMDAESETRN